MFFWTFLNLFLASIASTQNHENARLLQDSEAILEISSSEYALVANVTCCFTLHVGSEPLSKQYNKLLEGQDYVHYI